MRNREFLEQALEDYRDSADKINHIILSYFRLYIDGSYNVRPLQPGMFKKRFILPSFFDVLSLEFEVSRSTIIRQINTSLSAAEIHELNAYLYRISRLQLIDITCATV